MKICGTCCDEQPKENFSKKQWQLPQYQRRCKECIALDRKLQVTTHKNACTQNSTEAEDDLCNQLNHAVKNMSLSEDDAPSCWICLDEGVDEGGKPLVRDCSCRGGAGFAHLSCLIRFATERGKNANKANDSGTCMETWRRCFHCKQFFCNQLGLDMANAHVNFTEQDLEGTDSDILYYHLPSLVNKLAKIDATSNNSVRSLSTALKIEKEHIAKHMLAVVKKIRPKILSDYENGERFLPDLSDYESTAYEELAVLADTEDTPEGRLRALKYYEMERDIVMSYDTQTNQITLPYLDKNIERLKLLSFKTPQEFFTNGVKAAKFLARGLDTKRAVYDHCVKISGKASNATLESGAYLGNHLKEANCAIEAERLLIELYKNSRLVHGPNHALSANIFSSLEACKTRVVSVSDEQALTKILTEHHSGKVPTIPLFSDFQAYPHPNVEDKCILQGPIVDDHYPNFSRPRTTEGESKFVVDYANVDLKESTPVVCRGLKNSSHLNGKLGEVRKVHKNMGRYTVHFEEEGLKPVMVKHENLRIVFELPDRNEM